MKKRLIWIIIGIVIIIVAIIFLMGYLKNSKISTGISEKVEIPISIENNCIGFLIGNPKEETETITDIGGGWARPHPGPFVWEKIETQKGKFDFRESDFWIKEIQNNNVAILATIWPYADWDQKTCHSKGCEVGVEEEFYNELPKSRCTPCNLEDYKDFIEILVERYDGDGFNDMPGLKIPIQYWEVLNEPEMAEPELTFFKGSQKEYVEILKASYESVKNACSKCKVVQGGAQHSMPDNIEWWQKVFDLNGEDYFDIANIHYISEGDLSTLNARNFKALLEKNKINKEIWVTEAQYGSEEDVIKSVEGALNEGASKIFFTQFTIGKFGVPKSGEYSEIYEGIELKCRK